MVKGAWPACIVAALLLHGIVAWGLLQRPTRPGEAAGRSSGRVLQVFAVGEGVPIARPVRESGSLAAPATLPIPVQARGPAPSSPHRESTEPGAAPLAPVENFRSPAELDRAALPLTDPDVNTLVGVDWPGLPIRVRVFIDAHGAVVDVKVVQGTQDPGVVGRIRAMFLATAFIPGRLNGADVASYKDVDLSLRLTRPVTDVPRAASVVTEIR